MRLITRLKHRCLRLLGVVSVSGAYPLPPRWALSKLGKHRFYDAPSWSRDLASGPFIDRSTTSLRPALYVCAPDCALCASIRDLAASEASNGRQRGAQSLGKGERA